MTQAIRARRRETGVLKERHHLSGVDVARGGHHSTLNATLSVSLSLSLSLSSSVNHRLLSSSSNVLTIYNLM